MNDEKFEYFMKRTEQDFTQVRVSLAALHKKTDSLFQFKWQIVGGSTLLSGLFAAIIAILTVYVMAK